MRRSFVRKALLVECPICFSLSFLPERLLRENLRQAKEALAKGTSPAPAARSTSHIFAALKGRQNLVDLYCLSPFQGWDQLLVRSPWFRTTLRSVLHHWLPSVAPPALDSWILQKPLKHIGQKSTTTTPLRYVVIPTTSLVLSRCLGSARHMTRD